MIDHVGGQDQGDLAQLGKLAFDLGRVEDGILSAFQGMAYAVFGGGVDQLDFIGGADESFGNRVGYGFSANRLHLLLFFLDVLEINGGDDGDSGGKKLFHVLPALGIDAAGRVLMGQPVDQDQLGTAPQHGGDIDRGSVEMGR